MQIPLSIPTIHPPIPTLSIETKHRDANSSTPVRPYRPYFADHNVGGHTHMDARNNRREIRTGRSGKSAANITIHPLEGRRSNRMRQADYLITANP